MPAVVFDGHEKPLRTQLSFFYDAAWSRCLDHSQSSAVVQLQHVLPRLQVLELLRLDHRTSKESLLALAKGAPREDTGST